MARTVPSPTISIPRGAGTIWRSALALVKGALERRRQRLALAQLDARLLCDVGLTLEQAQTETAKPFWR
jgi:uncharacterized protein YjiS (DUF1127 family)